MRQEEYSYNVLYGGSQPAVSGDNPSLRQTLSPRAVLGAILAAICSVEGDETAAVTKGRHDPCVGIRAVPVGEAMMACVLADR